MAQAETSVPTSEIAEGTLRVWWTPQVPGPSFEVVVPDLTTAGLMCDVLARYDLFQYENHIKPDYCNAGGIVWFHDGEWEDIDPDDEDDVAYFQAERAGDDPNREGR